MAAVDAIRSQPASYHHLLGEQATSWPLPQLRTGAVQVHQAYQAAEYHRACEMLPALIEAADALDGYQGRDDRETHLARCSVYVAAAKILTKVGEHQLGWLAADRATHAAIAADSKAAQGMAAYQIVIALLRSERTDDAERVALRSAEEVMPLIGSDKPDTVSLAGSLWLISSVIAARRTDRSAGSERLGPAGQLADLLGHDGNHWWTAFGPTNVQIHRASVASEFGTRTTCSGPLPKSTPALCRRGSRVAAPACTSTSHGRKPRRKTTWKRFSTSSKPSASPPRRSAITRSPAR